MRKSTLAATVAVFILISFSVVTMANGTVGPATSSDTDEAFKAVGTYDLIKSPVAGIAYTPECLIRCNKPVKVSFKSDTDVTLAGITRSIEADTGNLEILRSGVDLLVEEKYDAVTSYKEDKCQDVTTEQKAVKNATHDIPAKNVTARECTYTPVTESKTRLSWVPFKDRTFKAGEPENRSTIEGFT